jgi:hypothetical protein
MLSARHLVCLLSAILSTAATRVVPPSLSVEDARKFDCTRETVRFDLRDDVRIGRLRRKKMEDIVAAFRGCGVVQLRGVYRKELLTDMLEKSADQLK